MSCNPAIGGLGKGHLVREVDALDGDHCPRGGRRRDPSPHAERQQGQGGAGSAHSGRPGAVPRFGPAADQCVYPQSRRDRLGRRPICWSRSGISCLAQLWPTAARCAGARGRAGDRHLPRRQSCFSGEENFTGGRIEERAATALGRAAARRWACQWDGSRPGTPPRLDGRTIDWAALEEQASDGGWLDDESRSASGRINPAAHLARSPAPTRAPMTSSASGLDRSPSLQRRDRGQGSALLSRRSRTRSTASAIATAIRSFWSRRG
jgi:tRNA uridine 5-carboxymethylaminomethyl modification enzyme